MHSRTVIGVPASYNEDQTLDLESTARYVEYLDAHKAGTVMTTAGTSHFNLLDVDEIHELNKTVVQSFTKQKIIGVPSLSLIHAKKFIEKAQAYLDESSSLMFLYPDRYYNDQHIIDFMYNMALFCGDKIYIHGKTIRKATGGVWDYNSNVLNSLYDSGLLKGLKEEHSSLSKSYDFVSELKPEIDVIVAGGSMRRYEYLRSAGANSFLSGVGNLFPQVEQSYLDGDREKALKIETKLFNVFMKYGWHKSLRIALDYLDLACYNNREPWPKTLEKEKKDIMRVIEEIKIEK